MTPEVKKTPVNQLLDQDFESRKINDSKCTFGQSSEIVTNWKKMGNFVIANGGTFDILSLNHIRGLVQCRILGAMAILGIDELNHNSKETDDVYEVATSDKLKLIVSIDTNEALENNKSRRPEKGGSVKPILDWETRAKMVSNISIPIPGTSLRRNAVDFITSHGPNACNGCFENECLTENTKYSVSWLDPNLTVTKLDINSSNIVEENNGNFVIIDENDGAFEDKLLNGQISTTNLINRIRL
jgi:hypothetical protein